MKIRLLKMMIVAALLLVSIPVSVMADSANVTLKDITDKVQGNSVTVEGTTSFDEILIKIIRPNNTVFYYDVVLPDISGNYTTTITLPSNADVGTYTVVVGKGADVATDPFKVSASNTGSGTGGGGGGGGVITVPTTNTATIQVSIGGIVTLNGATISFPAGALGSDIKVTVDKVTDPTKLPMDTLQKLISDVFEITKDKEGLFQKSVTITLPFDKSELSLEKFEFRLYWLNETTGKWIPLDNQQVDLNKGVVSGTVNHFTKFAVLATEKEQSTEPELALADIKGHWAEANIVELIKLGAISGYPDQTFKPNNKITRAEFVSVLVKAFNIEPKDGKTYADTANHWARTAISTAAEQGIVNGFSETTFGPNEPITREQMAAMIVKAAKLPLILEGKTFTDSSDISAWATSSVATASSKGLLGGYEDGSLKPKGNATRAEAVTVILKAISINK
ncbi:S-layer homology domain-containing protein [Paenibacillus paridis]|uniref:S-layer homology domain-containing protein n=1 Tax=Paenibacillus paridis TaxID=2583376 RepID=UPI001391BEB4|nr:S-layer homology domain-containing protein [Paenibacillus paridis]